MPRKPRIEYEDAIYHIMNRGNYRDDTTISFRKIKGVLKNLVEKSGDTIGATKPK